MNKTNQFFAAAFSLAFVAGPARGQSQAPVSGDATALPIASIAGDAQPGGAVFTVTAVDAGAYATVYALERVGDGARVSVEISCRGAHRVPLIAAGTIVTTANVSTGCVLAAGSQSIAFIPNALGRALMRGGRIAA
ncbi:MAG TPA: hypothetical protein VIE63_14675 [Ramlibacter sp.]|jgi:hypothetical protein